MFKSVCTILAGLLAVGPLFAQRDRISQPIHGARVTLAGHLHPKARAEFDQGRAAGSLALSSMMLVLKPSAAQQADLDQFLAAQQNPASPDFHRWITPEQYADRFGLSSSDIAKVTVWLEQQNLEVISVARARNGVSFRGTAAQAERAFATEIHRYQVDGELHFANATEPALPSDLAAVVSGIRGLNDFRMKARIRARPELQPENTSGSGNHYLAPDDFATIYNVTPLYAGGIDGSGQKIVVVGQTQVDVTDLQQFRTRYNLPGSDPQMVLVPGLQDPGISKDDLPEADLDLEWSSAVARKAAIIFVYSFDVTDAVHYAIDQNLAPVLSMSYGLCEAQSGLADALMLQTWAKQANTQGITWIASSGDSGGADCASGTTPKAGGAQVDLPAGVPEVTGVGGTEFNENGGAFWNTSNTANGASARSYIPEMVWNDSLSDGQPSAGGGGASMIFTKPTWQTGAGVPNDSARDVPDVALNGSADHDGYLVFTAGSLQVFGGTSVSAPSFAGIVALLNHRLVLSGAQTSPGIGNMNPGLYQLAQTAPQAFHDITTGNNQVTISCTGRSSRNCIAGTFGFSAGAGYDQASGLGSVDADVFVTNWSRAGSSVTRQTPSLVLTTSAPSIDSSGSVTVTATVRSSSGATPTGTVTFLLGGATLGSAQLNGSGLTATATLNITGADFPLGSETITAQYGGDAFYSSASGTASISVITSASTTPAISGFANAASFRQAFAPGMLLSIFGTGLAPSIYSAATVPLPDQLAGASVTIAGVNAPLYYVSPTQLNVQIPYEAKVGSQATVTVNNNGHTVSQSISISAAAPGIFVDGNGAPVPGVSGRSGQAITLFITGDGALSPALATGAGPAAGTSVNNLPAPIQNVTMTVGGANANIFFIGVPPGLVGVTQVNYTIPAGLALGTQSVIVNVGGVATQAAKLTVTK